MKKYIYVLVAILSLGLVSCDNYFNHYKRSRAKIDKLLSERKFEQAREVANKLGGMGPDVKYVKQELLSNITYTQINMLMEDGDYETASELARELQREDIFYDAFFKDIRKVIKRGNYDFVFETIMDWQCPVEAEPYEDSYLKNSDYLYKEQEPSKSNGKYYGITPGKYNWFIRPVNNAIDIVLQKVMYEGYPTNIRRCLMCYKPYSVFDRKEPTDLCGEKKKDYYRFYFKMQNTAKEEAEKMLREAKIEY